MNTPLQRRPELDQQLDSMPLGGQTYRIAARSLAAHVCETLLSDLGARIVRVPAEEGADVSDLRANGGAGQITLSSYGARGRLRDAPEHDSAVMAVGGALHAQWTYEPGPAYLLTPYGSVAQGILTAIGLLARELGRDLPAEARPSSASTLEGVLAIECAPYTRVAGEKNYARWGASPRGNTPAYAAHMAADDWLFVGAMTLPLAARFLRLIGLEELLEGDPSLQVLRGANAEALWDRVGTIMRTQSRDDWVQQLAHGGVPVGPLLTLEQALVHPQLHANGLVTQEGGADRFQRYVEVIRRESAAPPRSFAHSGPLPLSQFRVVELATWLAGPGVGRQLTDMGADVVHVEAPEGDPGRGAGTSFIAWNHGKKSLTLDLRVPAERERLLRLVGEADAFITNYRPESLARLGLDREQLFAVNPTLIHHSVSVFGEAGPFAGLPGFDPLGPGLTGVMKRQGGDGEPVKSQMSGADINAGLLGALGVLAARIAQLEHGGGYTVRTSLLQTGLLLSLQALEELQAYGSYQMGGRDFKGPHPLNGLHRTSDGWILTALQPPYVGDSPAEAERYLEEEIAQDSGRVAIARLAGMSVPAVPCIHPEDLLDEPHFATNNLWVSIQQPQTGTVTLPAPVLGPRDHVRPAPRLGDHNEKSGIWSR